MKTTILILAFCLTAWDLWAQAAQSSVNVADVRKRLAQIYDADEQGRTKYSDLERQFGWGAKESQDGRQKLKEMDRQHLQQVEQIIEQVGTYPGRSLVGQPLDQVAFLVIQHSNDRTVREKYLPIITDAAQKGEVDKAGVAELTDQIRVQKGEKQVYGTQIRVNNQGQRQLYPIDDEANVDQRRKAMDLEPLATYLQLMGVVREQ